ncbi:MAG: hypothetical protein Q4F28_04005 [Eubacteriales bacterium]|nr:hypothetical protein [Eubacteriales bacterium]
MADLRELTTDAKRLYEAMDTLLAKQDEAHTENINFGEIWFSAKARPFKQHILTTKDSLIGRKYLTILASMISLSAGKERRTTQIRFMARILAACKNPDVDIENLVTDGMLLTEKSIDEFQEIKDEDLQIALLIDLLLMCYLNGQPEEKQLDFAIGFMAMLGLKQDTAKAIGCIVKGLLEQNDGVVMGQRQYMKIEHVYCYMKNPPDGVLVHDLEQAKHVAADKIIFISEVYQSVSSINFNDYEAKVLEFKGCSFVGVQEIYNTKKQLIFDGCTFEKSEVESTLMKLRNARIKNCKFLNLTARKQKDLEYLLVLEDSIVEKCIFKNINIYADYKYLGGLSVSKNTIISGCDFDTILVRRDFNYSNRCMIRMHGGSIFKCKMSNCKFPSSSYFFLSLESKAAYSDNIASDCEDLLYPYYIGDGTYLNDFFKEEK